MAKVKKFLVVIGYDGEFTVIDHPMKMCGYRPERVYCFGEPETDNDTELFRKAWMIASAPPCQFHHFP